MAKPWAKEGNNLGSGIAMKDEHGTIVARSSLEEPTTGSRIWRSTVYMQQAIPLSDMGHSWLDRAKERLLAEPGRFKVLEHAGCAEEGLIPKLVQDAEAFSRGMDDGTAVRKRLVNVMMEAVDNVGKHALGILCNASFILLVRDARSYLLTTGNAVPIATATLLEHRIGLLNEMHREDLREHYLKLLSNGSRSAHGGAGLGLLTLARKCNRPIEVGSEALGPYTAYLNFTFRIDLMDPQEESA